MSREKSETALSFTGEILALHLTSPFVELRPEATLASITYRILFLDCRQPRVRCGYCMRQVLTRKKDAWNKKYVISGSAALILILYFSPLGWTIPFLSFYPRNIEERKKTPSKAFNSLLLYVCTVVRK